MMFFSDEREVDQERERGQSIDVQVTLDNSKFKGPSINFERSRVRVFKSPEISGSIDWFSN